MPRDRNAARASAARDGYSRHRLPRSSRIRRRRGRLLPRGAEDAPSPGEIPAYRRGRLQAQPSSRQLASGMVNLHSHAFSARDVGLTIAATSLCPPWRLSLAVRETRLTLMPQVALDRPPQSLALALARAGGLAGDEPGRLLIPGRAILFASRRASASPPPPGQRAPAPLPLAPTFRGSSSSSGCWNGQDLALSQSLAYRSS